LVVLVNVLVVLLKLMLQVHDSESVTFNEMAAPGRITNTH